MIRATVDDAQGVASFGKVKIDLLNDRLFRILEVDVNQTANRGCHLIHQAAGFAEVDSFCILPNLGDFNSGQLLVEEQLIQDGTEQNLKGCRGAETAARKDCRIYHRIKTFQFSTSLDKAGSNTTDQRGGGVLFFLMDGQVIQVNFNGGIAFRLDPDIVGTVQPDIGYGFQIHRGCENAAALVIGMVSTDFRSAGSGEYVVFFHRIKFLFERFFLMPCGKPAEPGLPFQHSAWSAGR